MAARFFTFRDSRTENLASADLLLGAESEPSSKSGGVPEPGDVWTDFHHDRVCSNGADARDVRQIYAGNAKQLASQIKLRFVTRPFVKALLCARRHLFRAVFGARKVSHLKL